MDLSKAWLKDPERASAALQMLSLQVFYNLLGVFASA